MENAEKAAIMVFLFLGFLWLRRRSRAVDLEKHIGRTVFGVFVLLPGLLIAGRLLFERFRLGTFLDLGLQAAFVLAVFSGVGLVFLPPDKR